MWEEDETLLRSEVFPLFKSYIEEQNATPQSIYPHYLLQSYNLTKDVGKQGATTATEPTEVPTATVTASTVVGGSGGVSTSVGVSGAGGAGGVVGGVVGGVGGISGGTSDPSADVLWEGVEGEDGISSLLNYLAAKFLVPSPKKRRMNNSILKKVL